MGITAAQMRELYGEFDVAETTCSNSTSVQLVARADPSRWAIIFAVTATSMTTAVVSTNPNATAGNGMAVSTTPVTLTFSQHGPLVGQAWYSPPNSNVNITVFEVFFRDRGTG